MSALIRKQIMKLRQLLALNRDKLRNFSCSFSCSLPRAQLFIKKRLSINIQRVLRFSVRITTSPEVAIGVSVAPLALLLHIEDEEEDDGSLCRVLSASVSCGCTSPRLW